jgi:hypothetical protein
MGGVFNLVNLHLYHYAGNNPVKYVDPDGREQIEGTTVTESKKGYYIILWSYAKADLVPYRQPDGSIDWNRFEKENPFARAAETKHQELIEKGKDPDRIIVEKIDDADDLVNTWKMLGSLERIESLDVFSHGTEIEPEVAGGSKGQWKNLSKLNWSLNAIVVFHGCHTAKFANEFAKKQRVTSFGQAGGASFSSDQFYHIPINDSSKKVYLFDWDLFNLMNNNGNGEKYEP